MYAGQAYEMPTPLNKMPTPDNSKPCTSPLTIVVPVLNEAQVLPGFLEHIQPYREIAELILVDGGSDDGTTELAEGHCDRIVLSEPGRARQMNVGAVMARGRCLLFLHCDARLTSAPSTLLAALGEGGWGFSPVRLDGRDWRLRMVETGMNWRSRLTSVATGDQALFVESELLADCGGYANLPLMEDVELCKRLRRRCPPRILPDRVQVSSRRWETRGVLKTVLTMWWLRLAYWAGANPARLARRYYG